MLRVTLPDGDTARLLLNEVLALSLEDHGLEVAVADQGEDFLKARGEFLRNLPSDTVSRARIGGVVSRLIRRAPYTFKDYARVRSRDGAAAIAETETQVADLGGPDDELARMVVAYFDWTGVKEDSEKVKRVAEIIVPLLAISAQAAQSVHEAKLNAGDGALAAKLGALAEFGITMESVAGRDVLKISLSRIEQLYREQQAEELIGTQV
jgi:hypothetical protein